MKLKAILMICVLAVFAAFMFSGCAGESEEDPSEVVTEVVLD